MRLFPAKKTPKLAPKDAPKIAALKIPKITAKMAKMAAKTAKISAKTAKIAAKMAEKWRFRGEFGSRKKGFRALLAAKKGMSKRSFRPRKRVLCRFFGGFLSAFSVFLSAISVILGLFVLIFECFGVLVFFFFFFFFLVCTGVLKIKNPIVSPISDFPIIKIPIFPTIIIKNPRKNGPKSEKNRFWMGEIGRFQDQNCPSFDEMPRKWRKMHLHRGAFSGCPGRQGSQNFIFICLLWYYFGFACSLFFFSRLFVEN
jgi:hypothetical protein